MRLQRIFKQGGIINKNLYEQLQDLDQNKNISFRGCSNEFKQNRDWWVCVVDGEIVAYCGCVYSDGICIFNRAWVHPNCRGNGMQRKMIKVRIKAAKEQCHTVITYTLINNHHSSNNLIKCGFMLYNPEYAYSGKGNLYWIKYL